MDINNDSQSQSKNRPGRTKLSLRRKKDTRPSTTQQDPPSSPTQQSLPTCTTSLDELPGFSLILCRCTPVNGPVKECGESEGTSSSQSMALVDTRKTMLDQSVAAVLENHTSPKQGSPSDDIKESVAAGIETSAYMQATLLSPVVVMEEHFSPSRYEAPGLVEQADCGIGDVKSTLNVSVCGAFCESSDSASDGFGELFFCQLCQKDLTRFSTAQRQQHINLCCDEREKMGGKSEFEVGESEVAGCHVCVLCDKVFKAKQPLLAHMKGCAKRQGISTTQLLRMKREAEACGNPGSGDALEENTKSKKPRLLGSPPRAADCDFQVPPPPDRPKRGRKRKQEGQSGYLESLEDEQLQLALAMSASLDPLAATTEVCPSESGQARRKRQRRGRRAIVGNENPPVLLLTSSSQAKGMVAQRAEQILTKLPSAAGDGSDDEIPCTPAFAASELGHNPVLLGKDKPMLEEDELLLVGEGEAEMRGAKSLSDVAIPTSSSEEDLVLKSSNRKSLTESESGMVAESVVTISKDDDMHWKQPTETLAEVTKIPAVKNVIPLSEGETATASNEASPKQREQTSNSKCLAALGDGDTTGLSYSTLWQLSSYQEHEDNTNFYVPALAPIISPVKAGPLCGICDSDPCVAVLHHQVSCKLSDVTITSEVPSRKEAKSLEHVTPVKTGIARLTSDLHSLIGSSLLSDVTITTRNGSKVPAHAALLACRCPALREVLAPPSTPITPHSAHLDLSDFDDEVVFACLEYLYTGSSPLLQKEGRGSSPLVQEEGRGSSPLVQEVGQEGLLERFALLAQRLSLEEFAHLFPSNAYCNSDGDTPRTKMEVEQVKPTCEPVADLKSPIELTIVEKSESVSLDPDECTSNPDGVGLQFHCQENEQEMHFLVNIETPKKPRRGLSELKDTTDGENFNPYYTPDREPDTQNMPQDCSSSTVVEVANIKTTSETLPCEGIQDATATSSDCNVVYVSSSPEEGSLKSPSGMLEGITTPDVVHVGSEVTMDAVHVAGTSPLKLSPLSQEQDRQRETDASSEYSIELCDNNDSLLLAVDETLVWNQAGLSPDCHVSRSQLANSLDKQGLRTGVHFATPRSVVTATTIPDLASTTPVLFATPTNNTSVVSVGNTPLPVNKTLDVMSASSVGGCGLQSYMTPAPSFVCVDLESDDNITPMPDYRTMQTPMLKGECSRFGVRALPKKKMIAKLEEIYDYTHPLVDADGKVVNVPEIDPRERPKATGSPSRGGKPPAKRRVGKPKPRSQDESTACSQAAVDLSKQVQECIMSNGELYQDMLLYQPLELSHIQTQLKSGGTSISKEKLMGILDHWCVTYSLPRASQAHAQKTKKTTKRQYAM